MGDRNSLPPNCLFRVANGRQDRKFLKILVFLKNLSKPHGSELLQCSKTRYPGDESEFKFLSIRAEDLCKKTFG